MICMDRKLRLRHLVKLLVNEKTKEKYKISMQDFYESNVECNHNWTKSYLEKYGILSSIYLLNLSFAL